MNNQNEINLINFFTRNKGLTRAQQARFAKLMARDCTDVGGNLNKNKENNEETVKMNLKRIRQSHSPKKMIDFLSLFSRDDRFKWFTHKWDMSVPFDIEGMIKNLQTSKAILNDMAYNDGPAINKKTYNQVWNFINFENNEEKPFPWTNTDSKSIHIGWYSVVDLSKDTPDTPIENLVLSDGHQFKDYIRMFKSTIEFRTDLRDDDRFSELIWNKLTTRLPKDFDINFDPQFDEIGYDLNIYCDVIGILTALDTFCDWMTKHKSISSNVDIDLIAEEDSYILEITQRGSYFNNIGKLERPSGDFKELRERLFSVCDLTLEGDYIEDGKMRGSLVVKALDENTMSEDGLLTPPNVVKESDEKKGGVRYKLRIYKR